MVGCDAKIIESIQSDGDERGYVRQVDNLMESLTLITDEYNGAQVAFAPMLRSSDQYEAIEGTELLLEQIEKSHGETKKLQQDFSHLLPPEKFTC